MLVDDKFIIILIPRCATTSFVASCQKYNIPTKTGRSDIGGYDRIINHTTKQFTHFHDNISFLTSKFGNDYPIIAVKRNKYDSFISLWKMILHVLKEYHNEIKLVETLSKMKAEDIFFFDKNEYYLNDIRELDKLSRMFFTKKNIPYTEDILNYIQLLYMPKSYFHNFDKRIIWFDFNKLNELEDWVSNKLNMEFKLEDINSSKEVISELKNDMHFKERFDYIYSKYEIIKENRTLI